MLRRSTLNYFYTSQQAHTLLTTVLVASARLEALIILFSRIIDLENHLPQKYLTLSQYAGQDYSSMKEGHIGAKNARTDTSAYLMRIGATNSFNPYWCDRHPGLSTDENVELYRSPPGSPTAMSVAVSGSPRAVARADGQEIWLGNPPLYDLRVGLFEERLLCKLLVSLASERDKNWSDEHMSGMPFELSSTWDDPEPNCGVPFFGTVSLQVLCHPGTIDLSLRTGLARRLLMPGPGRWRCVPERMVDAKVTPVTINAVDEPLIKGGDHTDWDDHTDISKLCLVRTQAMRPLLVMSRVMSIF